MNRYERSVMFERLVELRTGYGADPADTHGVLSIADAIIYAEAVLAAVAAEELA